MPEPALPPPTPSLSKSIPLLTPGANMLEPSCLTCARDLSTYSDMDALHHRAICFSSQLQKTCPICYGELSAADGFLAGSLLHLQRCQRGNQNSYSFIESDDFEALYVSLCGRTEITHKFQKRIEGGSQRSSTRFRSKIQRKHNHPDFIYRCEESALRNCVNADGEEVEGWRTAGDVGKAAKNIFPVVKEEFDPFIIMEGPQTQSFYPPTRIVNSSNSTSDTLSEPVVQALAPAQDPSKTSSIDTTLLHELPETGAQSTSEMQLHRLSNTTYTIPMPAADLPQVQKCIFCLTDPQGTHKRFDKIAKVDRIKCDRTNHDIFTCGRCTANYHPVTEATFATEAHALPRIILTSPDSQHSSILESFMPEKKALYPAPKRRGHANWIGYKWMPNIKELKTEKAKQITRARNRALRRESQMYGGVQLLAMGTLASTAVAFFPPPKKTATNASNPAHPVAQATTPAPLAGNGSSSTSSGSLSSFNMAWSNAITSQGGGKQNDNKKDSKAQKFRLNPLMSEMASQMRGYSRKKKEAQNDYKAQEARRTSPPVTDWEDHVRSFGHRFSRMLENFHLSKTSPKGASSGGSAQKAPADNPAAPPKTASLPVDFSSVVADPKLKLALDTALPGAIRSMHPLGKASYLDLANGSASHRPFLSPSVYNISFTVPSELCDDEERSSPFSRPPSSAWSDTSSTSTDSSCMPETDTGEGWEALSL
ncbi:hypothetical protein PMIN06_010101 [Paraphaeosphaeria minitans]